MKLNKHAWAVWSILLAVAIVLMILIPFVRTAAWWIAACCTVLMFALCAYAFFLAFRKDGTLESKVLGWPIFQVGYTALIVQLIVGAVLMGIAAFCPVWAAAVTELIVFAAAWKAIRARAAAIATQTGHLQLKKLAEEIRYADPTPTELDWEIARMLETLSSYADAANIRKAFALLEQRKAVAKAGK